MRYQAIVVYDGTAYSGWQIQPDRPSIQAELNKALGSISGEDIHVTGSGRTDGGVHAYGQVFHFDMERVLDDPVRAFNSRLPEDIHIRKIMPVNDDFHARYDACWKHYDYLINNGEYDPLKRNYSAWVRTPLNIDLMKQAAEVFLGTHDFTSFNATKTEEIADQIRTIYDINIMKEKDMIRISFYGSGFLRYMVRMMAATLIEIGREKINNSDIIEMLKAEDKNACGYNSPACGLYLMEVGYHDYPMH